MRPLFYCLFLFTGAVPAFAGQSTSNSEFGIFLGGSYYLGELNPNGHFNSFTQPAGGVIYRYNFNPRFSVKGNLLFGNIMGDDARSDVPSQITRNYAFKSPINELAAEVEFNFLPFTTGDPKTPFTPYVFGGLAVYKFNPQGQIGNNWYALQPLGTEGQGTPLSSDKKYKLIQMSLPFGVGLKFNIAQRVGVSLEWGFRKTFTDYLDDVSKSYVDPNQLAGYNGPTAAYFADTSVNTVPGSNVGKQRGDSSTKDWYSFAGIMLTFKLKGRVGQCYSY
ncbi:MAG: DUF6089 family protein [Bacteroidota bacterium]